MAPQNPAFCSREGVLFNRDQTTLIRCPAGKSGAYTIPDGVTRIENYAFGQCQRLTRVTIPDSVAYLGQNAFSGCDRLTEVRFLGNKPTTPPTHFTASAQVFAGSPEVVVYYQPDATGWYNTFEGRPTRAKLPGKSPD